MSIYSRTAWTSTRIKYQIYMTHPQHKVFASYQNSLKLIDLSCRTTYGWGTPYLTCIETDNPSIKLMAVLAKLNIKYNTQE